MSLGENSLVAAYQGKGQLKSRPSGTRVVTITEWSCACLKISNACSVDTSVTVALDTSSVQSSLSDARVYIYGAHGSCSRRIVRGGNCSGVICNTTSASTAHSILDAIPSSSL